MSKIPYLKNKSPLDNLERVKKHLGITSLELSKHFDVMITADTIIKITSQYFLTTHGSVTPRTESVKNTLSTFFTNGIPEFVDPPQKDDLFTLFGCERCEYRTKSYKGCYK